MASQYRPDRSTDTYSRLADGRLCRIRPSGPQDRELLAACLDGLSPESWRMRFFSAKHALSTEELDHLSAVDGRDHIAVAAVQIDETGRELGALGFARCLRLAPGGDQAELAITVIDAAQRQGLGTALLGRLVTAAQAQGIHGFRCEVLTINHGMRRLAHALGSTVNWTEGGVVDYQCVLPETAPVATAAAAAVRQRQPSAAGLPWYLDPAGLVGAWLAPWVAPVGPTATPAWLTLVDDYLALGGNPAALSH